MPLSPGARLQPSDQLLVKGWIENIEDVGQGGVDDLVVVWQAVELVGGQVQEHPMAFTHTED